MESLPFDCLRIIAYMVSSNTVLPHGSSATAADSYWYSHDYFYRQQREDYNALVTKECELYPGPSVQIGRLFRQISKTLKTIVDTPGFYTSVFSSESLGVPCRLLHTPERLSTIPLSIYQTDRSLILKDFANVHSSLEPILSTITNLQVLYLSNIVFTPLSIVRGLRHHRYLTKLYINQTISMQDKVMQELVKLPCNLTDIDISDTGLRAYPSGTNEDGTINIPLPPFTTTPSEGTTATATTTTIPRSSSSTGVSEYNGTNINSNTDASKDTHDTTSVIHSSSSSSSSLIFPLTDQSLFLIQQRYGSTLSVLRLAGCQYTTDQGIIAILQNCPNLQELDVSRNYLLRGEFLPYLFHSPVNQNLVRLNLSSIGSSKLSVEDCYTNALRAFQPPSSVGPEESFYDQQDYSSISLLSIGSSAFYGTHNNVPRRIVHQPNHSTTNPTLPKLQSLDVSWCPWFRDDILDNLLKYRLKEVTELKYLSLHACTKLSSQGIVKLRQWSGLAYVEYLDIGQLNNLDDIDVALLLSRLHGRHTSLTPVRTRSRSNSFPDSRLSLSHNNYSPLVVSSSSSILHPSGTNPTLSIPDLLNASMHYPSLIHLHTLDISGISRVSVKTFTAIGKHCPNLLRLKCRLNVLVNHKCFEAWFASIDRKYGGISTIDTYSTDRIQSKQFSSTFTKPNTPLDPKIDAKKDNEGNTTEDDIIDEGIDETTISTSSDESEEGDDENDVYGNDNYDVSEYCTSRTMEKENMASMITTTKTVTDSTDSHHLTTLLQHQLHQQFNFTTLRLPITHLDFWRCLELDNQSLMDIGQVCPYLTHIDIEGADVSISDTGICSLLKACPLLVHVSLASCTTTDRTLKTIAKYNPRLIYLDISGGLEYTTEGLTILFQHLPVVEVLKLYKLRNINDYTIYNLVKYCSNLRCLTLRACGMEEGTQEWIGMNVLGKETLTSTISPKDHEVYESIYQYFHSSNNTNDTFTSSRSTSSSNNNNSRHRWSPETLSRTSLSIQSLFLLGQIALPPLGHLTTLGLSFLPSLTVYDYYVFIRLIILRSSCSISILKFAEGITTPNLETLVTLLEHDIIIIDRSNNTVKEEKNDNQELLRSPLPGGSSVRMRRYHALSKLEYLIPNVRIEWRG